VKKWRNSAEKEKNEAANSSALRRELASFFS